MIANATEVKNNFGKYLRMSIKEDIVITSNGRRIARLIAYNDNYSNDASDSLINEGAMAYELPPRRVTYDEFLEISRNSEQRLEYIDGEVYLLASPRTSHQIVLSEIYVTFFDWFRGKKCKPMMAPYDITLRKKNGDINVVQPDIMVICDLEEKLDKNDYYMGIPALVVEIVSEGTRKKDLVKKLDLYMSTGIKEYWIVNPVSKDVAVFFFENGEIINNATFKNGERAVSFLYAGLGIEVNGIFG